MAGDWIPMRLDLYEDPAVLQMASELECREETVVGYCHKFWSWLSRQCHDGSVTGVTLDAVGRATNLPGFPELLVKVGWLFYEEKRGVPTITVPNFDHWLSESAKKRLQDAIRQRKRRHADVTKKSRSQRDKNVTTGEERRVHNNSLSAPDIAVASTASKGTMFEGQQDALSRWVSFRRGVADPVHAESLREQLLKLAQAGRSAEDLPAIVSACIESQKPRLYADADQPRQPASRGTGRSKYLREDGLR